MMRYLFTKLPYIASGFNALFGYTTHPLQLKLFVTCNLILDQCLDQCPNHLIQVMKRVMTHLNLWGSIMRVMTMYPFSPNRQSNTMSILDIISLQVLSLM